MVSSSTIAISPETKARLYKYGEYGQSADDIIKRVLDHYDLRHK